MPTSKLKTLSLFGPGILLAATAIGVSHLVQSVQAGAQFGNLFIIAIIFAHLIKLPFFEASPRYSAATGRSLLHGYYLLNPKYLVIYLIITLISGFIIIAAVSIVAGGLFANLFTFANFSIQTWSSIILIICYIILLVGKYDFLDKLIKPIIIILTLTTIIALIASISNQTPKTSSHLIEAFSLWDKSNLLFLIAFIGWMPCPLDCAVWNSVWIIEKKEKVDFKTSLLDFRVGFIVTAILAILFLSLGNVIFYGTGTELSPKSIQFINQFLSAYSQNIGSYSFYIIGTAAFFTMFSTVITCLDGTPRVLYKSINILLEHFSKKRINDDRLYLITLTIGLLAGLLIVNYLMTNMKSLIIIATLIAFLTTPILAYFNIKLLSDSKYPEKHRPSKLFFRYSYFCLVILIIFSIWFLIYNYTL
jgi:Mn2+/Fe2+ NRAMP family transporter